VKRTKSASWNWHGTLADLQRITANCRPDMHEPDEQGVSAEFGPTSIAEASFVRHPSLDNACSGPTGDMGFWLIENAGSETVAEKRTWFNLADVIAWTKRKQ
jgi:hypothetical protein